MLIKSSFSAYHVYSKNVALLCLVGIEFTLLSTWRRRPSYRFCAGVLSSWTHVESGESRSLHDEDLVADGIR
jgi:hypothetical protein